MRPVIRRAATAATASTLLLGTLAVAASPVSAVGAGACTRNDRNHIKYARNLEFPVIHTGPGARYTEKGVLESAQPFYVYCSAKSKAGNRWYYGKVEGGSTIGRKGWIWSGYFS
ncbi:hypothetical protein ACIG3E_32860 [Streptomyces sp. NPDC053474]|uniref:hypothetical protein n=1 Tax=Streptomyces sp. NPDC053474 TaxID=3365704 RepID=UPI0037D5859C